MSKVTAKEVAAYAGVSVSAVSRAYRSDGAISDEKRRAIVAAATELGFVSNVDRLIAQSARNTIAMVVSELHNPFYPVAIDALTQHLTALNGAARRIPTSLTKGSLAVPYAAQRPCQPARAAARLALKKVPVGRADEDL